MLIVEDEESLATRLEQKMRERGFAVDVADNGIDGAYIGIEYPIDFALIDIGLPQKDGISVIKEIRDADKHYPIIILTARGSWEEKVAGLDAGADDYLTKPFHMEELVARMNALIRRVGGSSENTLESGNIVLNPATQEVTVDGNPITLTAYEYRLLQYMMLNRGKVLSKMALMDHIYDEDSERDSNVIEVFVVRLRRKLDPNGDQNPIETLRGRGYRLIDR